MVLAVGPLAMGIASDPESRVLGLDSYAWAGFGAAFGPVVLFSVSWPRMTRYGALAGMLIGATTVVVWHHGSWVGRSRGPGAGKETIADGFEQVRTEYDQRRSALQQRSPRFRAEPC